VIVRGLLLFLILVFLARKLFPLSWRLEVYQVIAGFYEVILGKTQERSH
jgi:hypothetical protein